MALLFEPVKFIKESLLTAENSKIKLKNESASDGNFSGCEAKEFYENLLNNDEPDKPGNLRTKKRIRNKVVIQAVKETKFKRSKRILTRNDLLKASSEGELKSVEDCLKSGIDVNSEDNFKWTPLMCASFAGFYDIVEFLLLNGGDKNLKNLKCQTASDLAASNGYFNVVQLLDSSPCRCSTEKYTNSNGISSNEYCDACRIRYTATDHQTSTLHLLNTSKPTTERPFFHIPCGNKGYQLMIREGWNESSGLGVDGRGRKFPIKTSLKRDRLGLGVKSTESAKITHFGPFDVEAIRSKRSKETPKGRKSLRHQLKADAAKRKDKETNFRREFY